MKPEEQARQKIDDLLEAAGWKVQDRARLNLGAGRGIAIREFSLATGAADYLLFVDRQAVGTVEAKKVGVTLTGVEEQSAKYRVGLPRGLSAARDSLPYSQDGKGGASGSPRSARVSADGNALEQHALWPALVANDPEGVKE